jgi:hypothetical protein
VLLWLFYHATSCNNYVNNIKGKKEGKGVPSSKFLIFCHGGFWAMTLVANKEEGEEKDKIRRGKKKGRGVGREKSQSLPIIVGSSSFLPNLQGLGMNRRLRVLKEAQKKEDQKVQYEPPFLFFILKKNSNLACKFDTNPNLPPFFYFFFIHLKYYILFYDFFIHLIRVTSE